MDRDKGEPKLKTFDELIKEEAARAHMYAGQTQAADLCGSNERPARPGLRDRVGRQFREARDNAEKANRLDELCFLLDKNPEVARILDLIEIVRG